MQANGRVVLIGVVPNAGLTQVTALARALPGHTVPWGVTATAMCAEPEQYEPVAVFAGGNGSLSVAECPKTKVIYSVGYLIGGGLSVEYVYSVVPSADGRTGTVQGVGTAPATRLSAIAVCGNRVADYGRTEAAVPLSPGPTTTGNAPPLVWYSWVFGAGVHSNRSGVFVDAFSPSAFYDAATGLHAKGRVARLDLLVAPKQSRSAGVDTGGDDVIFYAQSIGSWY
jgi:hypothetical protein